MKIEAKLKSTLSIAGWADNDRGHYNFGLRDVVISPKDDYHTTITEIHGNFRATYSSWQFDPTGEYLVHTSNWKNDTPKSKPEIREVIPFDPDNVLNLEEFIEEYGLLDDAEIDQYTFIIEG